MAAVSPARRPAPRRARGGSPEAQPQGRPWLRVVDDTRLTVAHRRRRTRLVVTLAAAAAAGCLFLLAAFNAMLVSGQGRLDRLELRVAEAQSQYSANRLRVAELESPDRIVRVAQDRLGMVPPPDVTYLTPSEAMANEVGRPQEASTDTGEGGRSWAAVKPYLGR